MFFTTIPGSEIQSLTECGAYLHSTKVFKLDTLNFQFPLSKAFTNLLFRYTDGLYLCYKYPLKLSKTLLVLHLSEHSLEKFLGVKLYY